MFEKGHILNTRNLAKAFLHVFLVFSALSFSGQFLTKEVQRQAPAQTEVKIAIAQQKSRTVVWKYFLKPASEVPTSYDQFSSTLIVLANRVKTELALFADVPFDNPAKPLRMYYVPRISIHPSSIHSRG